MRSTTRNPRYLTLFDKVLALKTKNSLPNFSRPEFSNALLSSNVGARYNWERFTLKTELEPARRFALEIISNQISLR